MSDAGKRSNNSERNSERAARFLLRLILSVLCILLLIAISVRIYLATALPAPQLSRLITSRLQQNFTVQSLHISGAALVLKGVRLENPPGFAGRSIVEADSVAIAPQWVDLLLGRQRFRLIALEGIKVNLDKNSRGVWNFAQLQQQLLAGKKPSAAESYVKELKIRDGAFQVQGQGVQGISLQVFNLASKGSLDSKVDLAFEDAARNRYALKGKARAGTDAAVDLTLTAPSLSLKKAAVLLKLKKPAQFEGGQAALKVNATLHKRELRAAGDLSFAGLRIPVAGQGYPVSGSAHFAADYSIPSDTGRLHDCTLTVDNLLQLHAKGSARSLKGEREFVLDVDLDELDLARINDIVPDQQRKHMLLGGRLRGDSLHLEGNGSKGLRSATGTLQLRDGALTREGRLIVAGLSGTIGLSRKDADILARGKLSVSGRHDKALLEALDMPFGLTVSPRLKPVSAQIPALSASVMGIPVRGRIAFHAARANPVTASLQVPAARLSTLNSLLKRYDVHAASGTASATLEFTGKSAQELNATAHLRLSDVQGRRGKNSFAVKNGSVAAGVQRRGGRLLAQGDARLAALVLNGKPADARFAYRIADGMVYLDGAQVSAAGAKISLSRLSARIPPKPPQGIPARYPIALDMEGLAVKQRGMEVADLTGRVRGSFNSDGAARWLDATADLAAGRVSWQGKPVAAPVLHVVFSRPGGRGQLSGQLLGGKLAGTASFNPFALGAGGTFELGVTGAELATAAQLVPKGTGIRLAKGVVDLRLKGGYSRPDGLSCRFESKGSGIVLTDGAKTLLSGAGISLAGALAGGDLSIRDAVLSAGDGVRLTLKGELARALSPKRKGTIAFSLPQSALAGIVDPFVNILPRFIQEATVGGTMAADGKIELRDGKKLVGGALTFKGGQMEVASQKLVVADLNGRVPFSLDLSGKGDRKPQDTLDFSRENYPRLLERLRKSAGGGEVITAGKIAFGALELGKLTVHLSAADGIIEIASLNTSLYEGALLAKGFVTMREQLSYRGDLLVNGLSLRALCRTLPNLEGYISGRVDGVISLSGGGKGLAGITGFTYLWAREGSGEKMKVSKEFLQRLAKQKLGGFFFSTDRPYDEAEIKAMLEGGDLTFDTLKIVNTNLFGVRDLSVSIAPAQNRIALGHLLESIKEAALRGKPETGEQPGEQPEPAQAPATQEFKWGE